MKLQRKSVCPDVHSRQSAVAAATIFLMRGVRKKSCLLSVQAAFKLSKILLWNAFHCYPLWLQTC